MNLGLMFADDLRKLRGAVDTPRPKANETVTPVGHSQGASIRNT
jgi:hypothetical protein